MIFKGPGKKYIKYFLVENLKNLRLFALAMSGLCFLLWLDNEVPIYPLNFQNKLDYYNVSAGFFMLFFLLWILIKISLNYKQLRYIAYFSSILISFGFLNSIGYLEMTRGSGLTPLALGYVTIAVVISARLSVLISFFLLNGIFFYYLISQIDGIDISHYKMAIFSIIMLSVMVFVTAEKQRRKVFESQELLAKNIDELNKALDLKSVFFGHMSHELRTPLNAIIGFSEMILNDTYKPRTLEKIKEYTGFIHSGGEHLLKLVNDILDSSKIEAGEMNVSFEKVELGEVLQDYINEISSITRDKQQKLQLILENEGLILNSDKRLLKQIVFNLISNAQKFTSAGGLIEIYAAKSQDETIDITVKDNGKGIDEEILKSINDQENSIDTHFISRAEGTGLGLVIVRQLVKLLQGNIIIESQSGIGTEIKMSFPQ